MSEGFSAEWLRLREPFDLQARAAGWPVLDLAAQAARWRGPPAADTRLQVIDLACGSGSNLRALAPRVGGAQRWRLLDHDPRLLAAAPGAIRRWARQQGYRVDARREGDAMLHVSGPHGLDVEVELACVDLACDLHRIDLGSAHLVTAAALLDLVSAGWIDALLREARAGTAVLLFALSVDGRTTWSPSDAGDAQVQRLFDAHQRRDKGFGPALGPAAVAHVCQAMRATGYQVLQARSDWVIDGANGGSAMLAALIDGIAAAAVEQDESAACGIQAWRVRRAASLADSRLSVGHIDIMALPGPR